MPPGECPITSIFGYDRCRKAEALYSELLATSALVAPTDPASYFRMMELLFCASMPCTSVLWVFGFADSKGTGYTFCCPLASAERGLSNASCSSVVNRMTSFFSSSFSASCFFSLADGMVHSEDIIYSSASYSSKIVSVALIGLTATCKVRSDFGSNFPPCTTSLRESSEQLLLSDSMARGLGLI